jgi:hypothetical protein
MYYNLTWQAPSGVNGRIRILQIIRKSWRLPVATLILIMIEKIGEELSLNREF